MLKINLLKRRKAALRKYWMILPALALVLILGKLVLIDNAHAFWAGPYTPGGIHPGGTSWVNNQFGPNYNSFYPNYNSQYPNFNAYNPGYNPFQTGYNSYYPQVGQMSAYN